MAVDSANDFVLSPCHLSFLVCSLWHSSRISTGCG